MIFIAYDYEVNSSVVIFLLLGWTRACLYAFKNGLS